MIPATTRDHRDRRALRPPGPEPPQTMLLVTPADADGRLAVGRPRRPPLRRDARPGEDPGGRAGAARRRRPTRSCCRPRSWPPRSPAITIATDLAANNHVRSERPVPTGEGLTWPDLRSTTSAPRCAERQFPTVTVWNRLEGRPRTPEFDRALRAEVRDAAVDAHPAVAARRVPRRRRRLPGLREAPLAHHAPRTRYRRRRRPGDAARPGGRWRPWSSAGAVPFAARRRPGRRSTCGWRWAAGG